MINIVIDRETFSVPTIWSELTLDCAKEIKNHLTQQVDVNFVCSEQHLFTVLVEKGILQQILLDVFGVDIKDEVYLKYLWDCGLSSLFSGLVMMPTDYQIQEMESFVLNNKTYHLPSAHEFSHLRDCPLLTTQFLCRVNKLYFDDPLENAEYLCALFCTNYDKIYEAKDIFKSVTMDIVFEVFNLVCVINRKLNDLFPDCYHRIVFKQDDRFISFDWSEMLLYAADAVPSEVEILKCLHCCDFLELLSYKIKKN